MGSFVAFKVVANTVFSHVYAKLYVLCIVINDHSSLNAAQLCPRHYFCDISISVFISASIIFLCYSDVLISVLMMLLCAFMMFF